jgi:hypothetical protein
MQQLLLLNVQLKRPQQLHQLQLLQLKRLLIKQKNQLYKPQQRLRMQHG